MKLLLCMYRLYYRIVLFIFFSNLQSKDRAVFVEVWDWDAVGRGINESLLNNLTLSVQMISWGKF